MKKLKTWQFVLLVIFYPIGIIYFIVWLLNKSNKKSEVAAANGQGTAVNVDNLRIVRDIHTKVVGVTFGNNDGSSRQKYISQCKEGQQVQLIPMNDPEHPESTGVFTMNGKQLGHLTADMAHLLHTEGMGKPIQAVIANITGGGDRNYGCNLHIIIYEKPTR